MDNIEEYQEEIKQFKEKKYVEDINEILNSHSKVIGLKEKLKQKNILFSIGVIDNNIICMAYNRDTGIPSELVFKKEVLMELKTNELEILVTDILVKFDE